MADLVLSPVLDLIIGNLANSAIREVQRVWGVDEELEKLQSMLSAIQAVLEDAEEKQVKYKLVNDWLQKLKDVAYDAEDLVDEFAIEAQQQLEMEDGTEPDKKKKPQQQVCNILSSCFSCANKIPFRREMACRIEAINGRLDRIAKEQSSLGLNIRDQGRQVEIREHPKIGSLIDSWEVFGRGDDKENIIQSLFSGGGGDCRNRDVSVTSIVGMGGLGKTTLAQFVYNDKRVTMHFELRAWVCVSEDFDVKRLTKEIIESASGSSSNCDFSNIEPMQRHLQEILSGKRFLLVLDDVWNENYNFWEQLRAPLILGAKGSKVLVTTRNETVSTVMQSTFINRLQGLTKEDCLSLFISRAFADGGRIDDYPGLSEIAQKLVDKCDGLPLAAKALGGLLYANRDKSEWEGILNSKMWNLPGEAGEILPALRLSYHHLPAHLKCCFKFCSIYPKDYKFGKHQLVSMWIANGFIHPEEGRRVEDTGSKYFNDLCSRSFFQHYSEEFQPFSIEYGERYTMHDLMHDFARSISGNEYFRMVESGGERCNDPKKVRHLFVSHSGSGSETSNIEALHEFESLRTLVANDESVVCDLKTLGEVFKKLRFLRVLDLENTGISELPNSIGRLKHLRYLNLSMNDVIDRLPESVTSIYNLQTLNLNHCNGLAELPKETRKLKNLRHLHFECLCGGLTSMPPGIGRLTCLQELSQFIVGREAGQSIAELKDMTEIRGSMEISNLENVADAVEAQQANLKNKPFLDTLDLYWSDRSDRDGDLNSQEVRVEEEVLEALQPHPNLKKLYINQFMGTRFPSWTVKMPNLVDVNLDACSRCTILPPLGQLPSLKSLTIRAAEQVKKIGQELCGVANASGGFPLLEKLYLGDMFNLEEWCGVEGDFPCLRSLEIWSCPNLRQLSRFPLPSSLENMSLVDMANLEEWCGAGEAHFPHLYKLRIEDCPKMERWLRLPAVTELEISMCHGFLSLPPLQSLTKLILKDCNEGLLNMVPMHHTFLYFLSIQSIGWLTSLPQGMLQPLTQLKELEIHNCPNLVTLLEEDGLQDGGLPSTLTRLQINSCHSLKSLPMGLHGLTSLESLEIRRCPQLSALPEKGLPTALRKLQITGYCPSLRERCQKEQGKDWPKISHIPDIRLN